MMSKIVRFLFSVSLVVLTTSAARAESQPMGVGIILGAPTGISFKADLNSTHSVDAALAWSESISIHVHGDYLWNRPKLFFLDSYPVDLYYGVGARLRDREGKRYDDDEDGMQLGVRGPVGLRFMFKNPKVEVFTELAVIMNIVPSTDADFDFGVGARYYF